MCRKRADLSFIHRNRPWIIELKTGLDFNSLGAATLGAVAFLARRPTPRYMIISLYDMFKTIHNPATQAMRTLKDLNIPHIEDLEIHVLTRPPRFLADPAEWHINFAKGVERLIADLPSKARRSISD